MDIALVDWGAGPQWVRDANGWWVNGVGGRCSHGSSDRVIERRCGVTIDDWREAEAELGAAEVARVRAAVLEQCGGDTFELRGEDGSVVAAAVPRAPFVCWSLHRTSLRHKMPPWRKVSESGAKMVGDDPYHSDWFFGAGFSPGDYDRSSALHEAAADERHRIQQELGSFKCDVVVGGAFVMGVVGRDVAVLPDLRPDRIDEISGAKAIITEVGGIGAHLAQVALDRSVPMVRIPGAVAEFPPGTPVTIDTESGQVNNVALDDAAAQFFGADQEEGP